jgi:hypothetical protein
MAKLILTIGNLSSEIEVEDSIASQIRDRAWKAHHRNTDDATDQEKLDWLVNDLLSNALNKASDRLDRIIELEERRALHEQRRNQRLAERESADKKPKFK